MRKEITINMGRGTYTFDIDPDDLGALGSGILSYLGCSFEILWPQEREDRERRAHEQKLYREGRDDEAEQYGNAHAPWDDQIPLLDRDDLKQLLADAYRTGWQNAPKGVRYPDQSKAKWSR